MKTAQHMLLFAASVAFSIGGANAGEKKEEHFDIFLAVEGGAIRTGAVAEDGSNPTLGERVFGAELGEIAPNFAAAPGFRASPGTFSAGTAVGFNILDALRLWNGADFSTVSPSTMLLEFGPSAASTPPSPGFIPGFSLPVEPDGGLHDHLDYTLNAPASAGVYLLTIEFFTTQPMVGNSDPVWVVFNQQASEADHDAAIEWVRANLVPAPGAVALAAPALVLAAARRQRR